ncbi:atm1 [Acrasis kona]|uniref:Atm1 n=1 Tax=Acrasis kona TaxID=1008807 RepID=A0AAW2ZC63_9EUKA
MGNSVARVWDRLRNQGQYNQMSDIENQNETKSPKPSTIETLKTHFNIIVQLLPYLWPKDWNLRLRVSTSLLCLLLGQIVSATTPFAYRSAVDSLTDSQDMIRYPLLAIILYGLGGLTKE